MSTLSAGLIARASLEANGFRTRKTLGQNFLLDDDIPASIVEEMGLTEKDCVLEIGPGPGVMTSHLADTCERVVSVELDKALEKVLSRVLEGKENVRVVYADALREDLDALAQSEFGDREYSVVANLPYYITTELVLKAARLKNVKSIGVMVQKEAADRLLSDVGDEGWCESAALVKLFGTGSVLLEVPRDRFEPAPHVDSRFIRLERYEVSPYCPKDGEMLRRVIRAAFLMRRKTMANNLMASFPLDRDGAAGVLTECGLDARIRGEKLTIDEMILIADRLKDVLGQ